MLISLQAVQLSSILFVGREYYRAKMRMTLKMLTLRRVSESDLSLSVREFVLLPRWSNQSIDNLKELELDEEGTRISLTIVDTPGFGDQIDNEARLVVRWNQVINN